MRVLDRFRRQQEQDAQIGYDPRQRRGEIAQLMANALELHEPELEVGRVSPQHDGPLGGQSARFVIVERDANGEQRKYLVQVYAHGVFTPGGVCDDGRG